MLSMELTLAWVVVGWIGANFLFLIVVALREASKSRKPADGNVSGAPEGAFPWGDCPEFRE